MQENIYNAFKNELGYTCVTNQYIELSVRKLQSEYAHKIETELQELAKTVNLTISKLTDDYETRICKGYIVSINSALDKFLSAFKDLPGSPANLQIASRKNDESLLEWTKRISNITLDDQSKNDYNLCNYYHLVRNTIVHNGTESGAIRSAFHEANRGKDTQLNAPNRFDNFTFDDQVLFSRAAQRFAENLFKNSHYDFLTILSANKDEILKLIEPFQEDTARQIAARKLERYMGRSYPVFTGINWRDEVNRLLEH